MFLRTISIATLVCTALTPSVSISAPVPATSGPASPGVCSKLAGDYDQAEKSLSMTYAEGVGDDSAPRETYRQIENSNDLARASMMLTLMQAHHCALPDHAPSEATYLSNALTCTTDRLKGTSDPASCKFENWQPSH